MILAMRASFGLSSVASATGLKSLLLSSSTLQRRLGSQESFCWVVFLK